MYNVALFLTGIAGEMLGSLLYQRFLKKEFEAQEKVWLAAFFLLFAGLLAIFTKRIDYGLFGLSTASAGSGYLIWIWPKLYTNRNLLLVGFVFLCSGIVFLWFAVS